MRKKTDDDLKTVVTPTKTPLAFMKYFGLCRKKKGGRRRTNVGMHSGLGKVPISYTYVILCMIFAHIHQFI